MRFRIIAALTLLLGATLFTAACGSTTSPSSLASIAVTGTAPFAVGAVTQLTATGMLSDGTTEDVTNSATWLSSDPSIAMVSSTGVVTGVAPGTASVFATVGTVTGALQVNVASGE